MFSIAPFFIVRKHKVVLYTSKVYEVSDVYITVEVSFSFLSVSLSLTICLSLCLSLSLSLSLPPSPSPLPVPQSIRRTDAFAELMLTKPIPLCDDIKVEFYHNPRFGSKVSTTHTQLILVHVHVYSPIVILLLHF